MTDPVTVTYNFTGGWQKFNVPGPVSIIKVALYGGGSGSVPGGRLIGKYRVKGKDDIYILVGEHGHDPAGQAGGGQTTGGGGAGGAGGHPSQPGGGSGGGATEIRLNAKDGELLAIAGGAGGTSGGGGAGGAGGGNKGGDGHRDGGGSSNVATGGTQSKGGNGGTTGSANFNGENAGDAVSGRGGAGGHTSNDKCQGGGGGGGGYHAGGGGQAGKQGSFGGGGGGGGSNWNAKAFDVENDDKSGVTTHGRVEITYDPDGDPAPITPTNVKVNGVAETPEMPTRALAVTIEAKVKDVTSGATWVTDNDVCAYVLLSSVQDPGPPVDPSGRVPARSVYIGSGVEATGGTSTVRIGGLQPNTLYYGRVYTRDKRNQFSTSYQSLRFWSDRSPNPPEYVSPGADTEFDSTDTLVFTWDHNDPDQASGFPEAQAAAQFQYRLAATVNAQAGPWVAINTTTAESVTFPAANLAPGRWYEWRVASSTRGLWSQFTQPRSFFINAIAVPPSPLSPSNGEAIYAAEDNVFRWKFNTMIADETQVTVDIQYRAIGASAWEQLDGDTIVPGSEPAWIIPAETFITDTHYEWQIRSHTSSSTVSAWSPSATFWAVALPYTVDDIIPIDVTRAQEAIGQGDNKVFVYMRGGTQLVAAIDPIYDIQWERKRDDIGTCIIHVNEWDPETRDMLRSLKPWAHELVVFRNGTRCWEGPITRISGTRTALEIEARDVMAYVYRRIMRQGYNDAYQIVGGQQVGLHTVVYRAQRIITNALVYDDPNVLPFLTPFHYEADAIQSRVTKAFTKTAFDEVDELAAKAGLDYSVSGRRIILNDVHRPIGRLPELGDGDFSDPPIVTVYGMQFATDFGVTNNNGIWGLASKYDPTVDTETGHIEQLASEYGESEPTGGGGGDLTPAEIAALQTTLTEQAVRNIAARYPMPVVVRVPDNSSLSPDVNLGINQLIPGVWVPLRSTEGIVQASQWQKLDSLTVRQDENGEKIALVFSPAPNAGQDPDADLVEEA